ncbi:heme utilization cystosolic carrier protein HutX [Methylophaga sp. OBS1]|uniref:heme utilization cystosolic carrier protein HutX n=1 Tax=Methylophaga sp. OBS1 TaxID=2991933 RepID=UPI0022501147|nr:heme utilization cystosolic carrier protein HutX [Methylophaga sp. OBS1]MCX4192671.1 heme utilization cystosolic carrier protein HutX [Methylophaga sp. OBS1]
MTTESINCMPGEKARALLEEIADWEWVTTIVIHGGSVFEFKGPFPRGSEGHGFYNLEGPLPGFHGHLNLERVAHIRFQDKAHRGRESYAFVFEDSDGETIFKIFLGRDANGELMPAQTQRFKQLQAQYQKDSLYE